MTKFGCLIMSSLASCQTKVEQRVFTLQSAYARLAVSRKSMRRSDRFAIQEGLMSSLWQTWSYACRTIVLESARGTVAASGGAITSPYSRNSVEEIAFVAMKAARDQPIRSIRPIAGQHNEPTWGDYRKLNKIILAIRPTNSRQLVTALGAPTLLPDLQTIRNACAHIGTETIADVRRVRISYDQTSFIHPSDAAFWIDKDTNNYLFLSWSLEIRVSVRSATA